MSACASGYEAVVRVLLESEKVTQDHIGATNKVSGIMYIGWNKCLRIKVAFDDRRDGHL
jgi:hypothetical protein